LRHSAAGPDQTAEINNFERIWISIEVPEETARLRRHGHGIELNSHTISSAAGITAKDTAIGCPAAAQPIPRIMNIHPLAALQRHVGNSAQSAHRDIAKLHKKGRIAPGG